MPHSSDKRQFLPRKNNMGRKTILVLVRLISADYLAGAAVLVVVVAVVLGGP